MKVAFQIFLSLLRPFLSFPLSPSQLGELSPSFAISHVRDALIAPVDRVALASCWTEACQFIKKNETRVREETKNIKGEEYLVWR